MKKTLTITLLSFGLALGCSNNKAATADNANSAQPASSQPSPTDSSSSASSSTASSSSSNPDQQFVSDAAKGNRAEVELGKMIASKTSNPAVKHFAQMMVDDHTKALNQLQQIASQKNINLPDGIPDDAKDLQTKLTSESGKQLDKDYMDGMVQDHEKDVQEFKDASQKLHDTDVKQWATKTLPTLQQHLQRAKQVHDKLNGGNSSDNSKSQ